MHKNVEVILGRLATDPALRKRFATDATGLLRELAERGVELTGTELEALASTEPTALDAFAASLDRRLRKAATSTIETGEDL